MTRFVEIDAASGQMLGERRTTSGHYEQGGIPAGHYMIDVTDRRDAVIGGSYTGKPPLVDDWTWDGAGDAPPQVEARTWKARDVDTFTARAVERSRKVSKALFLGALTPDLYKAWKTSTDPILMYALALFEAETLVDLDSAVIAQVVTQARALTLIDDAGAAALQQRIGALLG